MSIPALNTDGVLPLGRHHVTLADVEARYVRDPQFAQSSSRVEIWDHFKTVTSELQKIVPVAYVWVSGSYISNKQDPDDIDVVYWCEDRHVSAIADPRDRMILQMFATRAVRSTTGLRVDAGMAQWHVYPEAASGPSNEHLSYIQMRGFWDDFWLRRRSGPKGAPPVREDALPRAGYLEMMLDGIHVV
ncbi:hypothetical protein GCM10010915_11680 [Microbacterium faecale]|uniref:Uncharacterized protein n=1 Tax=Microbacterium faecale TaxID=1804630 RepID=A0A917DG47_9MICO|nr:hypothetical protein [Microbacterium faecale]GGD32948.1 hypothetical protein GCM10010915_11680 [Microbacterium faecale]